MRWTAKKELCIGDIRVKTKFLLFPKNINDEVRWLEKATYSQKYETVYNNGNKWLQWTNISWINNCEHDYILTDTHCLGMNPPQNINSYKCSKCDKTKTVKEY